MDTTLFIHIVAGVIGLVSGFVALFAAKGARLHRKSGMVFVGSMLTMSLLGALIAAVRAGEGSVVAGLLAAYLVTTALTTVRTFPGSRQVNLVAMLVALVLGVTSIVWGLGGSKDGIPAGMFFLFGAVALMGGISDLRRMRSGELQGPRRIARHLWRMCFALFIASASFFLGQADEFPAALRIPALLAIPAFLPLVLLFYWRRRVRKSEKAAVSSPAAPTPAGAPWPMVSR
jgi:hypothetical protein